jgi:peptidoglycan/LPS O-acetylase OafA/YrhL
VAPSEPAPRVAGAGTRHARSLGGIASATTYIFAWPIQALVRHFIGADPWLGLLVSTPIILIVAWASWHVVERPALRAAPWVTATVDRLGSQSRARLAVLGRT